MNNENQPGQYFFFGRPVIIIGIFFFVILINLLSIGYAQNQNKISEHLNSFITWRNIGPAPPGGRTVDLAVVENEPWVIYGAVGPKRAVEIRKQRYQLVSGVLPRSHSVGRGGGSSSILTRDSLGW